MAITILAIMAGVLYRLGGTKHGTLWRDLGVPTCVLLYVSLTAGFHWSLIASFGLLFAALTTYNKWFGKLVLKRKDNEVHWEGWLITGLFYGLSMLPYTIYDGNWLGFGLRASVLALFTCLWSESIGKDWLEEGGRGFAIIATLGIFL
jgi:hypothetical protein